MKSKITSILFCLFQLYFVQGQNSLNNGLVAYYPFNDSTLDVSGNSLHGVEVNTPMLTSDYFGRPNAAYRFNGTSSYISLGDILDSVFCRTPSATFSVTGWAKTTTISPNQGDNVIIAKSSGGANGPYQWYIIHEYDGKIKGLISYASVAATNLYELESSTTIPTNTWYNFILTYDGSLSNNTDRLKFYVNGSKGLLSRSVGSGGRATLNSNQAITIGGTYSNATTPVNIFDGSIDEIRIYNRVLDSSEVVSLQTFTTVYRTGLDNLNAQNPNELTLYPNPSQNGIFNFDGNSNFDHIIVYDARGMQIKNFSNPTNQIDLSELNGGIYFIDLISDKMSIKKKVQILPN